MLVSLLCLPRSFDIDLPLMGQLTPAHVIFSPRLSRMSLPLVLHGPWNAGVLLFATCLRALYLKAALLVTSDKLAAVTTLASSKLLRTNIVTKGDDAVQGIWRILHL
jgi:hypothetical protein